MTVWTEWYPPMLAGMEMLAGFHYFTRFIGKRAKVVHYLVYLLAVGAIAAYPGKMGAEMLLFGVSLAAAGALFYRAEGRKAILCAVVTIELLQICFGVFDTLSYLLFPVFYRKYPRMAGTGFMVVGGLLALLLFALCSQAIYQHFLHVGEDGRREGMLLPLVPMLLLVLVSRYISVNIFGDTIYIQPDGSLPGQPAFFLLALQILGIASLFCVLYSDKKAAETFRLRMECSLLEQETRYMEQYVEEAKLRYEKTSAFRHDIRNHMSVVRGLLRREKYGRALSYLEDLEEDRAQMDFPCATNNPVVDMLVSAKLGVAADYGIQVSCSLKLPCLCRISDMDFGIVLSNALDNAIQACREAGGGQYITVKGRVQGALILLEVENSYAGEAGITEGRGLANIRAVAEKYQGKMQLEVREGSFCLSVLLVIPQQ
ncbi:MAG: GHKL domain-containing protein [Acetatifactor sp.]|nr:GHKL domain-containing protein [Acetatifactor sp.]